MAALGLADEAINYLPTGDGICIGIFGDQSDFDAHIRLALHVLDDVERHNASAEDEMRRFQVRVGLNENTDNVVTDINGEENLAGAGINTAQRVMSFADGSQVLVSASVHETLRHREKYMEGFRQLRGVAKHGVTMSVFQFVDDHPGLSTEIPAILAPKKPKPEHKLTAPEAYYLAHAIANEGAIAQISDGEKIHGQTSYSLVVALYFLASDSVQQAQLTQYGELRPHIVGEGTLIFEQAVDYYDTVNFWLVAEFCNFAQKELTHVASYLAESGRALGTIWHIVSEEGRRRLREQHPAIWEQFGFAETAAAVDEAES